MILGPGRKTTPLIYAEVEEFLGRELNQDEKDYIWIIGRVGAYGWVSPHPRIDLESPQAEPKDTTQLAKLEAKDIGWKTVSAVDRNLCVGILRRGEGCFAQFVGVKLYQLPLSFTQAVVTLKHMLVNKSLLSAVELSLGVPLMPIHREIILRIMGN